MPNQESSYAEYVRRREEVLRAVRPEPTPRPDPFGLRNIYTEALSARDLMPDATVPQPAPNEIVRTGTQIGRWATLAPRPSVTAQYQDDEMPATKDKTTQEFYNKRLIDFLPRLREVKQDGDIGLEIECEGDSLFNSPLKYWTCHNDGSLRNSPNGSPPIEYVLRKPMSRKEVTDALEYLEAKLRGAKSRVLDSHRTSVHVHFNCQQWTLKEIVTFVCLYVLFENALVEFSGPDRVGNLFCQRAKDSQFWVYSIVRAFQTGQFRDIFSDNFRYTSCNTASLGKFGSLEFRSMRGTVDRETIENWINLLDKIRQKSRDFKDPYDLYEKYQDSTPGDFLSLIFKETPKLHDLLSTTSHLNEGIEQGSIFVRDIAYAVETWKEAIPETKKKSKKQVDNWDEERPVQPAQEQDEEVWNRREQRSFTRRFCFTNDTDASIARSYYFAGGHRSGTYVLPPMSIVYYDGQGFISLWTIGNSRRTRWLVNNPLERG